MIMIEELKLSLKQAVENLDNLLDKWEEENPEEFKDWELDIDWAEIQPFLNRFRNIGD